LKPLRQSLQRQLTSLLLDDCHYALQATIPRLTRSSLHRCLQRHGISRLPEAVSGEKPTRKKSQNYLIGYFRIDIAETKTTEGKLQLLVATDQISKFALTIVCLTGMCCSEWKNGIWW
jgi:hypothetical protein